MSRLPGDRNSQQQPQQQNQNQQIIQPIQQQQQSLHSLRHPLIPTQQQQQQSILTLPSSGSLIVINSNNNNLNASDSSLRAPLNTVNTIQNSIYYSTPPLVSAINQNLSTNVTSISTQFTPTSHLDPSSPIAKKRLKLEVTENSSSCGSTNTTEDLSALKKRISEHKLQRLKGLKEK